MEKKKKNHRLYRKGDNMPTIGLIKGLLYYRYETLWKSFFDILKIPYQESKNSTLKTLELGKNKCVDETCLSLKLFIGHIEQLKDHCDLILIPRIFSLEKKEQVCTNFNALYDIVRNLYPERTILHYNIDVKRNDTEEKAFLFLGKQLGLKKEKVLAAYKIAKTKELEEQKRKELKGQKKLTAKKKKILLLGHPYNIKDPLIGKRIIAYLQKQNIEILYEEEMPRDQINKYIKKISPRVHWTMNKELLAAFAYFKDKVDGTIVITAFPCGPDSLSNEMILRKRETQKVLLLTFEDLTSDVAIITRLESFMDMLKGGIHL